MTQHLPPGITFLTFVFLIHLAVCFCVAVLWDRKKRGRRQGLYRFLGYFYPMFGAGFGITALIKGEYPQGTVMVGTALLLFALFSKRARQR
jgi:hypothetical protein